MSKATREQRLEPSVSSPQGACSRSGGDSGRWGLGKQAGLSQGQWEPWMVFEQERHM